jgi:hypothetical protein
MDQLTSFGKYSDRNLYFLAIKGPEEFPKALKLHSAHFALLLACDAGNIADSAICHAARLALGQGSAYLCVWGPDCKRVHDLFDKEKWASGLDHSEETTIMTTWHDDEMLDDVLWFFLNCVIAAGKCESSCQSFLAISVDNDEWAKTIKTRLSDPEALNRDVVGPETEP